MSTENETESLPSSNSTGAPSSTSAPAVITSAGSSEIPIPAAPEEKDDPQVTKPTDSSPNQQPTMSNDNEVEGVPSPDPAVITSSNSAPAGITTTGSAQIATPAAAAEEKDDRHQAKPTDPSSPIQQSTVSTESDVQTVPSSHPTGVASSDSAPAGTTVASADFATPVEPEEKDDHPKATDPSPNQGPTISTENEVETAPPSNPPGVASSESAPTETTPTGSTDIATPLAPEEKDDLTEPTDPSPNENEVETAPSSKTTGVTSSGSVPDGTTTAGSDGIVPAAPEEKDTDHTKPIDPSPNRVSTTISAENEIESVPSSEQAGIAPDTPVGITTAGSAEIATPAAPEGMGEHRTKPTDPSSSQDCNPMRGIKNSFGKKRSKSELNMTSLYLSDETEPQPGIQQVAAGDKTTATADGQDSSKSLFTLVKRELEFIDETSKQLQNYDALVTKKLENAREKLVLIDKAMKEESSTQTGPEDSGTDIDKELRQFKKFIRKMKLPISSKFKVKSSELASQWNLPSPSETAQQFAAAKLMKDLPKLQNNPMFEETLAFRDFEERYEALPLHLKLCLLCFSAFPEGAIVKKRFMVYWWIGEGFVGLPVELHENDQPPPQTNTGNAEESKDLEQLGAEYFDDLIKKDFVEEFSEKPCPEVDTCRMHPFVRISLITLATTAKFFDFDANGKPLASCPSSFRGCLLREYGLNNDSDFEKIHLLLNVSETILDIKPEWFPKMKNVNILCLGRWQASDIHHIEVEDTKFLDAMSNMEHLKFLSLQGISRIMRLPISVTKLVNLTILDLRACHNLEVIPDNIGSLKSLTHLDLSECYLLDKMPKKLASLKNLLVLKGFVVVRNDESCSLMDLQKLPKLRKLSIFTGLKDFPEKQHLHAFSKLTRLFKLKLVWGGGSNLKDESNQIQDDKKGKDAPNVVDKQSASKGIDTKPPTNVDNNNSAKSPTAAPAAADPATNPAPALAKEVSSSTPALTPAPAKEVTISAPVTDATPPVPATNPASPQASASTLTPALEPNKTKAPELARTSLLPNQLLKLDLQCFPLDSAPNWLKSKNLINLKKLYVRGGQLSHIIDDDDWPKSQVVPWEVEVLRLKYLNELEMNWQQLRELFPRLVYLEKVKCPKLTLFPCDEAGVWKDKIKGLKR